MTGEELARRVAEAGAYDVAFCERNRVWRVVRTDDSASAAAVAVGQSPEQAWRIFEATRPEDSGYRDCSCRDCFELTVGTPGEFCHGCIEAGCNQYQGVEGLSQECQRADAYGDDSDESDDSDEPSDGGPGDAVQD